jgi:two-component system C4-dicarboxylate transport response regulator DctD
MRQAVSQWLGLAGLEAVVRESGADALALVRDTFAGIVVTDLKMDGVDGLALLESVREIDPDLPVVIITGHGDVETAVKCMRLGAYDFIEKPFEPERFLEVIRRASEKRQLVMENRRLRQAVSEKALAARIIGTSKAAENLRASVAELASTDVSVILLGETGVGKELVARCLHEFGRRRTGHFVPLNCAGILENATEADFLGPQFGGKSRRGKLEQASSGTLFLDEIDSMPSWAQAKLLDILQDHVAESSGASQSVAVDFRPVAASKIDLHTAAAEGKFRSDLYYRLSVVELRIPSLRERKDDIPLLFDHFACAAAEAHSREIAPISSKTIAALMAQDWPGNVREVRNAAERYVLGLGEAAIESKASGQSASRSLADQVEAFERTIIERCLLEHEGRINSVMEELNIPRRTLSEKMTRFGLDRRKFVNLKGLDNP